MSWGGTAQSVDARRARKALERQTQIMDGEANREAYRHGWLAGWRAGQEDLLTQQREAGGTSG